MRKTTIIFIVLLSAVTLAKAKLTDSLRMDSMVHELPDVLVKGERPIAKVKGGAIIYDLPRLISNRAVDNAYEAVKLLPEW